MALFFRYLILELKRSLITFGKSIITIGLVLIGVIALALVLAFTMKSSTVFDVVSVGMVIPQEEVDTDTVFAVRFLEAMDSVKSVSGFTYYQSEEEACKDLQEGKLKTVISLPPYFFEDVDSGKNTPAKIYIPANASFSTRVFVELLKDGVRMLQVAEAGVYAFLDVAYEDRPYYANWAETGNVVAYAYVTEALLRGGIFKKEIISAVGTNGYESYYLTAGFLLVLLLQGWNFAHLFQKKSKAFSKKLDSEGLGLVKKSFIWLLIMTLLLWGTSLLLYGILYFVSRALQYSGMLFDATAIVGLLFVAFCIASYFYFVYATFGGERSGCLALFTLDCIMMLGAGLIIPVSYLPRFLAGCSNAMPLFYWDQMALSIFYGDVGIIEAWIPMGIAVAMILVGGVFLWKKH